MAPFASTPLRKKPGKMHQKPADRHRRIGAVIAALAADREASGLSEEQADELLGVAAQCF